MKYRIVKDRYAGFEAQYKHPLWPWWVQCNRVNSSLTIERAREIIDRHAKKNIVEEYTPK